MTDLFQKRLFYKESRLGNPPIESIIISVIFLASFSCCELVWWEIFGNKSKPGVFVSLRDVLIHVLQCYVWDLVVYVPYCVMT